MAVSRIAPKPYADALLEELDAIEVAYIEVLEASGVVNTDPNRGSYASGIVFVGYASWDWAPSDGPGEAARMRLLGLVGDFRPRFELLFPHPTPAIVERHKDAFDLLERWLERPGNDHSVPSSIPAAVQRLRHIVSVLRDSRALLPEDPIRVRLVVDTNTLIDNPDLTVHAGRLGNGYRVHLLPVVLRELDDHKRFHRREELREAAKRADRRLKGLRDNGDVRVGVRVAGDISAVFEHVEPRGEGLPGWLDLTVPDDRFLASVLLLQSAHPGSAVYVATGDLNLQTKLAAVRLPFVELPD
ncbi:PIN domain-containing protein [Blastococcus sp. SYSU DS0541]